MSLCCCWDSPRYSPVDTTEKSGYKLITPPDESRTEFAQQGYPASMRSVASGSVPSGQILVKSGGNALQAVDQHVLEEKNNAVAVSVPEGVQPGNLLTVLSPDGSGRIVQARVPEGLSAGHTFFVDFPPLDEQPSKSGEPIAVTGIPVDPKGPLPNQQQNPSVAQPLALSSNDLLLTPNDTQTTTNPQAIREDRVLVHVPPGASAGDKIRVQCPNGQIIEATVPEGGLSKFYVQVPPTRNQRQNWHDNPLAYGAPMIIGPALL